MLARLTHLPRGRATPVVGRAAGPGVKLAGCGAGAEMFGPPTLDPLQAHKPNTIAIAVLLRIAVSPEYPSASCPVLVSLSALRRSRIRKVLGSCNVR
jgi:hypothetical protein